MKLLSLSLWTRPEPFLNPPSPVSSSIISVIIPSASPMAPLFFLCSLISLSSLSALEADPTPKALIFPLTHSLSRSANTTHHLLKSSSLRSAARHGGRQQRLQVSLPLTPGSDYTLSLSVGPTTVDLYMDTGSDLVWFPCSPFECILCEGKPGSTATAPPPPPPNSSLLPCSSPFCSAAHSSLPSSDLCAIAGCSLDDIETSSCRPSASPCPAFYYAYGDGSLVARLRSGPLSLPAAGPSPLRLQDFTFACAHSALAEPIGVAGFGGGALSLPAQLAALHPGLAARFSYCLVSHSFDLTRLRHPSPLILGRSSPADQDYPFVYTPMLSNPKNNYFYSVGLEAISVGAARIPAKPELAAVDNEGNGGMVVDSGTTYTMLPGEMHGRLAREFDRAMRAAGFEHSAAAEKATGLGPCYGYADGRDDRRRVPGLALHFAGNASVPLPRRNYFLGFEQGGERVGCLMLMSAGEDEEGGGGGPAATLGNYQQQGFEVVYDLAERRIGFARRRCAALWDSLSRGG